jgi:nucleoside-triphosphatase
MPAFAPAGLAAVPLAALCIQERKSGLKTGREAPNVFFTGLPGCGKSTLVEKLVRRLERPCTGFFTRELREGGRRVGFAITTLDGRQGVLAHIKLQSPVRVGKYGVNLPDIDRIAVPAMRPVDEAVVVVVDEIGKMECLSRLFRQRLVEVLDSVNIVVGAIAMKGNAFIEAVKKRPDTDLITVSKKNRDALLEALSGTPPAQWRR